MNQEKRIEFYIEYLVGTHKVQYVKIRWLLLVLNLSLFEINPLESWIRTVIDQVYYAIKST
jgi:hypothetical protein